jgi:hypothetical protein
MNIFVKQFSPSPIPPLLPSVYVINILTSTLFSNTLTACSLTDGEHFHNNKRINSFFLNTISFTTFIYKSFTSVRIVSKLTEWLKGAHYSPFWYASLRTFWIITLNRWISKRKISKLKCVVSRYPLTVDFIKPVHKNPTAEWSAFTLRIPSGARRTAILRLFMIFLCPSRKIPGYHLKLFHNRFVVCFFHFTVH